MRINKEVVLFNPRKIITRLLVSFAAVSLIAPLSACGNAGSSSDATSISFYSYFNKNQIGNVLTAFQKKYPKIKIDMQSGQDPQQYVQTLQTRLAGGQAPTIFNLTMDNRTDVMKSGAALDISGSDFFEGINDSNFRLFQQDGKTYGMPVTAWYGVLVYNKDLLGKAGFNQFPRTWDAFIKMGEKLNSQNVTTFLEDINTQAAGSLAGLQASYYASKGVTDMDSDIWSGKSTFEKNWGPVFAKWQEAVKAGVLSQSSVGISSAQIKQSFITGKLAVMRSGPWDYQDLKDSDINYGVAPFPAYDDDSPQMINGGPDQGFAISSKASDAQKTSAKKFLAFLNSKEALKLFTTNSGTQSLSEKYTADSPAEFESIVSDYLNKDKYYWVNWGKSPTTMTTEDIAQQQRLVQLKTTGLEAAKALDAKWQSLD